MPPESSHGGSPKVPVLFIDRDTWSYVLDAELKAAGIPFVAHREVFPDDTPDTTWIAEVGKRGWTVVTRDQNIRRRPNELRAVRNAGLRLFALTSGNLSAADTAATIIKAWRAIQREVASSPAPALFSVSRNGDVRLIKQ